MAPGDKCRRQLVWPAPRLHSKEGEAGLDYFGADGRSVAIRLAGPELCINLDYRRFGHIPDTILAAPPVGLRAVLIRSRATPGFPFSSPSPRRFATESTKIGFGNLP